MTYQNLSYDKIKKILLKIIYSHLANDEPVHEELTDNVDLLKSGLIDSISFMEIILQLENDYNIKLDISKIDNPEFTTISGLITAILKQSNSNK